MLRDKEQLKQRTIELLTTQPHRDFKTKELARLLKIAPRDYTRFRTFLQQLTQDGVIACPKSNRYRAAKPTSLATGRLHVKSHGYGFLLTPEGEEDVFISLKNLGIALNGDLVKVQLFARPTKKRPEGRVIEVLERKHHSIVGTLKRGKHYFFLVPDDLKIARDIFIPQNRLNGAKPGQKVAVEIDHWEDELLNPEGRVTDILGFPGEPGVDVKSIAASFSLPMRFPKEVEDEAARLELKIDARMQNSRLDLRSLICITIDPPDAKDFDDAVSLRRLENGRLELGVHIADVSHFVREGSALEKEALNRGTSVYLVDRVVPMLPERLSTELCSLKPRTDRLTYSCLMELTPAGDVMRYRIAESIIHSRCRFSYAEVQAFLDGTGTVEPELTQPLQDMAGLARTLRRRRMAAGSLAFEMPEPKIILNDQGAPVDIQRGRTLESMKMIEEFMLLANKTVARHVQTLKQQDEPPPFVYRVHEKPSPEKIAAFSDFVSAMGHPLQLSGRISGKKLNAFIKSIPRADEKRIIERVMLRSLMKARYDIENLGHFGLAFKYYSHFTSPIRRYPDLAVHRLLKFYSQNGWNEALRPALTRKIESACQQASERETVAQEAERASIKLKQVEFMASRLGEEFDGVISGITHFGIFVEITQFLVEGLIHISDLYDDFYNFDDKALVLEGTSSGEKFRLGDPVRVQLVRVDVDERIIDMVLVKKYEDQKRKSSFPHRKKAQKTSRALLSGN